MPALVVKATRLAPTEMHPTDSLGEDAVNEVACALPCRLLTSSLLPLHVMDGGKTCTPTLEIIYIFGFSFLKADGVVYVARKSHQDEWYSGARTFDGHRYLFFLSHIASMLVALQMLIYPLSLTLSMPRPNILMQGVTII